MFLRVQQYSRDAVTWIDLIWNEDIRFSKATRSNALGMPSLKLSQFEMKSFVSV